MLWQKKMSTFLGAYPILGGAETSAGKLSFWRCEKNYGRIHMPGSAFGITQRTSAGPFSGTRVRGPFLEDERRTILEDERRPVLEDERRWTEDERRRSSGPFSRMRARGPVFEDELWPVLEDERRPLVWRGSSPEWHFSLERF